MDTFDDMVRYVKIRAGEQISVDFRRGGDEMSRVATIGTVVERDRFGNEYRVGLLGIGPSEPVRATVGLMRAPVVAVERTGDIVQMMVETLGQEIGRASCRERVCQCG